MKNPKLQTYFRTETRLQSDNVIPLSQSLHVPQGTEEDMLRCLHVPERSSKDMLRCLHVPYRSLKDMLRYLHIP